MQEVTILAQEKSVESSELDMSAFYQVEEPEEFRDLMASTAVIPFGTGLWA